MKALAIADLHLTENPLEEYRHDFMRNELPRIVEKRKPDAMLILGDLTEAKDRHSARLVNRIVTHLAVLASFAPVWILMGNHDYANEGEPFFAFSKELPRVNFINRPKDVLPGWMFLPHSRDPERDWEGMDFDGFDFVFAHQAFQDADAGFGRKLDGYPTDRFKRTRVIAGDIHKPQTVGPIEYIGAPYTVDFGDDYAPRMLAIDGSKVRSIWLDAFPQKKVVHVHPDEDLEDHREKLNEGDVVRITFDGDDLTQWTAVTKVLRAQAAKLGLIVERVSPVLTKRAKAHRVKQVSGDSKKSDAELVRQFADRNRLDDDTLDAGLDIVEGK